MVKPALPFHERLFALVVAGVFINIIFLNYWFSEQEVVIDKRHPHFTKSPFIEVIVEGRVKKPGTYQVKKGTLVGEVVNMAIPEEDANLKRVKLDSRITRRRKIKIH